MLVRQFYSESMYSNLSKYIYKPYTSFRGIITLFSNINFTRDIFSVINRIEWVILIIQHNHFIGINHDKLPKND